MSKETHFHDYQISLSNNAALRCRVGGGDDRYIVAMKHSLMLREPGERNGVAQRGSKQYNSTDMAQNMLIIVHCAARQRATRHFFMFLRRKSEEDYILL